MVIVITISSQPLCKIGGQLLGSDDEERSEIVVSHARLSNLGKRNSKEKKKVAGVQGNPLRSC